MKLIFYIFIITVFIFQSEAKAPVSAPKVSSIDLSGLYFRIDQNEYGDTSMYLILTKRQDSKYNIDFKFADNTMIQQGVSLKCDKMMNCRMILSSGRILMNFSVVSKDIVVKVSSHDKSEVREIIDNGARFSQNIENKPFKYESLQ